MVHGMTTRGKVESNEGTGMTRNSKYDSRMRFENKNPRKMRLNRVWSVPKSSKQ